MSVAKRVQFRGGNTTSHQSFTGAEREITIDTTKKTVVVHDGLTPGGHPIAKEIDLNNHINDSLNPHSVTKVQVGLGNVDNTADSNKSVLSATKWTTSRTISLTGDVTGNVSFDGSANVSITATVVDDSHNHVISNVDGLQSALDSKADKANTYTKTEVNNAIAALVDTAPATLDTLNELASALGDDPNFATTVATNIGNVNTDLQIHKTNTSNPHGVTKAQVGLGNVDNTADADKNVLSATKLQTARTINGVSFDGTADIVINPCYFSSGVGTSGITVSTNYALFPAANDTITLAVGTYRVNIMASVTVATATVSGTLLLNPRGAGTAVGTIYGVTSSTITNGGASNQFFISSTALGTAFTVSAASAVAGRVYTVYGEYIVKVTTAGTFIPAYQFSATLTSGVVTLNAGNSIIIDNITDTSVTTFGGWD